MAKNRRKFTRCPNCGYIFEEVNNYCPNCGQENHDLNVPVKHLVWEFLEGKLHYFALHHVYKASYLRTFLKLNRSAWYVSFRSPCFFWAPWPSAS